MTARYRGDPDKESPFSRWIRNEPRLDSVVQRLSIIDNDFWCHKYAARAEQPERINTISFLDLLMLVEVKLFNSHLGYAQEDTLQLVDQIITRCTTKTQKTGLVRRTVRIKETRPGTLSPYRNVRWYGLHLLQLSGGDPTESASVLWDRKPISVDRLVGVLNFINNPFHPERLIDTRRHHKAAVLPMFRDAK